jgi:delta-1-pyrroline-5-carboxylate synthetase
MIHSRQDISMCAKRVIIKVGTSTLSPVDQYFNLTNMANIVERAANLYHEGKEVMIVSSGAAGVGRQLLAKQSILRRSMQELLSPSVETTNHHEIPGMPADQAAKAFSSACAAAGQLGLMSLYETMFNQFDIPIAQILVTSFDFTSQERRRNIQFVISQLLSKGVLPILNENDPVSMSQSNIQTFSDNDSLASLVAIEMNAQLLILLTDVDGVYDRPPTEPGAKIIDLYSEEVGFQVGEKSTQGRGGMSAKVDAALRAVKGGVQAVVVAGGFQFNCIDKIMKGETIGTLFLARPDAETGFNSINSSNTNLSALGQHGAVSNIAQYSQQVMSGVVNIEQIAKNARVGSRQLQSLSPEQRTRILLSIATALEARTDDILQANSLDVAIAKEDHVALSLLNRLQITKEKLGILAEGIRSIANQTDPLDVVMEVKELADSLILDKIRTPIGVLLIIFESRPDCLPQIAALAIRSGNGLILKGGKEAEHSNVLLHSIITECIDRETDGCVSPGVIGLVTTRADIKSLLQLDQYIDLVIPRGSNDLVKYIKSNTTIPVMGHADGVCHIYVDATADSSKALRIVVDSKTDYPSACNAVETVLLHTSTVESGLADRLLRRLRSSGVTLYGGVHAQSLGLTENAAEDMHCEYGDLQVNVEVVNSTAEAIEHINKYSSGHTECIVAEDTVTSEMFVKGIDSACVFVNASTRFSDGYRFGLGAEVGIATGKIHARGPVGMEGLMTYKWVLRSTSSSGHVAAAFSQAGSVLADGSVEKCTFTHQMLIGGSVV